MTRIDQAICAAHDYSTYARRGDAVMAEQAERTIVALVGRWRWQGGRYVLSLPPSVAAAMGPR